MRFFTSLRFVQNDIVHFPPHAFGNVHMPHHKFTTTGGLASSEEFSEHCNSAKSFPIFANQIILIIRWPSPALGGAGLGLRRDTR